MKRSVRHRDRERRERGPLAAAGFAALAAVAAVAAWALGPGASSALACSNETHCADVSISGHAEPQPIRRGETSELKITAKNDGPSSAYGIDVQVDVPHQLAIEGVEVFGGRSGCTVDGTFVRCDMGDFVREQLGVIRIAVRGTEKGTFISQARVYSQGVEDPNGGNGQVAMTIEVLAPNAPPPDDGGGGGGGTGDDGGSGTGDDGTGGGDTSCAAGSGCADVSISGKAKPRRLRRGRTTELKITPKNRGPDAAFGIEAQISVPRQLKIRRVRAYGSRGGCDVDGSFVRCDMGDFANRQRGVVRIKLKAKRRGRFAARVRVYSQGVTDPRSANNRSRLPIRVAGGG